jgi:3-phenylpropionate/cinnamic acid dioxygenase small subunit
MCAGRLWSVEDRVEIEELLFRFMASFDRKDWDAMRASLANRIDCDYSSFRGTPRATITGEDYVEQRKTALSSLKTQHNLSNLSISGTEPNAEVRCNYAILRFHAEFDGSREKFFHSYGTYRFGVVRSADGWRIASIEQTLLMSEGNPALHVGAAKS